MAGYTRNDGSNNIADGNIVNASDLDGEFDAIVAAFNASTGHTHDGTSAEGAPIEKVGPVQDLVVTATEVKPKTDNTLDLGTPTLEFKDLYIDGTANIDSLVADTADINAGTIDGTVIGGASAAAGTFTTLNATGGGALTGTWTNLGTVSTVDINGGTIDGVTIGGASAGAITGTTITGTSFVSSGNMTFGDDDKAIFGAGSDLQIYHNGSHSIIADAGTGHLKLLAADLRINNAADTETFIAAYENSKVDIYYDNSVVLTTTATGIDVTGTAVTDGLTVAGNVSIDGGTIKLDGNYPVGLPTQPLVLRLCPQIQRAH
jgi:hypothetical protein